MANAVFPFLFLLIVFSVEVLTSTTSAPPHLTFDCSADGSISNIKGSNISNDTLLVENGKDEKLCHLTDPDCKWEHQTKLRVIYDKDEQDKDSVFVAGNLYRFELECKSGYYAHASASAIAIGGSKVTPYIHKEHTAPTSPDTINITIFKNSLALAGKVHIGEPLLLKINGPVSHSLRPVYCTANNGDSKSTSYTLWNNTDCKSSDDAIMSNDWRIENDSSTIVIDMFAFRFVDSLTVTIECSAYVCPSNDLNCGILIKNCMPTVAPKTVTSTTTTKTTPGDTTIPGSNTATANNGRRRRRSIIRNHYKEENASTSFTVDDSLGDSNRSAGLYLNTLLHFTMLFVCMCTIGRGDSN